MITLGNSNGVIDSIYYYLWYKDESIKEGTFKVKLPDTIIFQHTRPTIWYFTSKKTGDVLLRKDDARTTANIMEKFCKNQYEGKVVAYFIYPEKNNFQTKKHQFEYLMKHQKKKQQSELNVNEKICIIYLTKAMLAQFLEDQSKPPDGILQKFIEPYGDNESIIQAVWSPSVCILSKQQNYRILKDNKYDPYERCVTFDGPEVYSRSVPLRGKQISQAIRNQTKTIIDKITNISYEKINVSRVVLYFKPDKDNVVWFLYSSSLRTQDEDKEQVANYQKYDIGWKNNPCKKQNNTPLALGINYCKPFQIKQMQTTNTIHPAKLLKDILCFSCNTLCQQNDLSETRLGQIIAAFDLNVNQNPLLNKHIQILEQDSTTRPPLITRVFTEAYSFDQQLQKNQSQTQYLRDPHSHIPMIILKMYPQITVEVYEQMRKNQRFLERKIFVCQQCYLQYEHSTHDTRAQYTNPKNLAFFRRSLASKPKTMQNKIVKEMVATMNRELKEQKRNLKINRNYSTQTYHETQSDFKEEDKEESLISENILKAYHSIINTKTTNSQQSRPFTFTSFSRTASSRVWNKEQFGIKIKRLVTDQDMLDNYTQNESDHLMTEIYSPKQQGNRLTKTVSSRK